MNDFTASNGVLIAVNETHSGVYLLGVKDGITHATGGPDGIEALREFFRAEEDKRLGRWRWPENPDYIVYPCNVKTRVRVVCEAAMSDLEWVDKGDGRPYEFVRAARAYFDAHPEPKPWQEAKPGEVWVVKFRTGPTFDESALVVPESGWDHNLLVVDARRVWPEVAS